MSKSESPHQRKKIFYGWYVLAASFIILLFNSGARFIIGILFKPMIAEFGWSRSSISLAFFVFMVIYAVFITITGKFYDRYGPKWVIIVSSLFLLIGYSPLAFIHTYWEFLLFYSILSSIGLAGTSVALFSAIISKWFEKNRGLVISLALSGNCLGQLLLIPVSSIFIISFGWRILCLYLGIMITLINIVLARLIIKGDPFKLRIKPLGSETSENIDKIADSQRDINISQDLGLGKAMKTSSFWYFLIVMFICGSGDFLVTTHLVPFVTDHGISAMKAGNMLAGIGLMSLIGILIAGPASDRIGNKIPISLTFLLRFFLFILILRYKNPVSFYIFSFGFGLTFLITAPLTPTLIGKLYGLSHVGILSGFITTVHHFGGGFWTYIGGLFFDMSGNYQFAFFLSTILSLLAFAFTIVIKEKRHYIPYQY